MDVSSGYLADHLQNNGRPAHQVILPSPELATNALTRFQIVDHVHFHIIPKPEDAGDKEGLVIGWPSKFQSAQRQVLAELMTCSSERGLCHTRRPYDSISDAF